MVNIIIIDKIAKKHKKQLCSREYSDLAISVPLEQPKIAILSVIKT